MKKIILILFLLIFTISCSKLKIFGFGEEKNKFDDLKINEYLWTATNDLLKKYSNTQSNLNEGSVSTDWIITKKNPDVRFKIAIYILGSNLIEKNIEVFTEKEFKQNGIWKQQRISESFNTNLKRKIILKAQSLDPEK